MKRFIKNNLFGFILGIILASSVGVIAYSITASDIGFTSSNESFTATNVQEAMDQLFIKSQIFEEEQLKIDFNKIVTCSTGGSSCTVAVPGTPFLVCAGGSYDKDNKGGSRNYHEAGCSDFVSTTGSYNVSLSGNNVTIKRGGSYPNGFNAIIFYK